MKKEIALNGFDLSTIYKIDNIDEVLNLVKQIEALKAVLESANTFREQSIKYAKLEATALVRVVELGGANKLRGNKKGCYLAV